MYSIIVLTYLCVTQDCQLSRNERETQTHIFDSLGNGWAKVESSHTCLAVQPGLFCTCINSVHQHLHERSCQKENTEYKLIDHGGP